MQTRLTALSRRDCPIPLGTLEIFASRSPFIAILALLPVPGTVATDDLDRLRLPNRALMPIVPETAARSSRC